MANRDMYKVIETTKGRVDDYYDLRASEMIDLSEEARVSPCEAVGNAFLYGYALGQRALRAKMKNPTCEGAQAGQAPNQAQ